MNPEPGGEGEGAVQLVAVLAHLGHGGPAPDHGHDALVLVVEGRPVWLPSRSARMFFAAH